MPERAPEIGVVSADARPALPSWLDLSGTTAIVTGGGTHLGRAMATALGELGAAVHLVGRRAQVVEATAAELTVAGIEAWAHAADAADEDSINALIRDISHLRDGLDVVVCNAGGSTGREMAPDIAPADLDATLRQNVTTTMVCAQAAARVMMPRRRGAIITVGSIHGSLGSDPRLYSPDFRRSSASYNASKGAVISLTRALACQLAEHGITANCISPGQVPRPGTDAATLEHFRRSVPLGRVGVPDDLKAAVALFATPGGRWITGQNLLVDGGWSAW
ncbi:MAG: SDR family NAD(P)-dependent oxidoreductase [Acidimicrobiales bacterium]